MSYVHGGLEPRDTRHYRVSATNEAGTGSPSNVAVAARVRAVAVGAGGGLRAGNLTAAREGGPGAVLGGSSASRNFGDRAAAWVSAGSVSHGDPDGSRVRWDGRLFSAHAGSDVRLPHNLLAGLAVSRAGGAYDWTDASGARSVAGTYEARLTSITPYAAWTPDGRTSVWAAASYGRGNVEIDDEVAGTRESAATMRTGAAGVTGRLLANRSAALNARAEGWASWVDLAGAAGVDALDFRVRRVRAALEWTQLNRFRTGHEVGLVVNGGLRYELNEGVDDVNGMELGGGLLFRSPARRLRVRGHGRLLLATGSDYEEWGFGATVQVDPGAAGGLALRLNPSYGRAESGVDALWTRGAARGTEPGHPKFTVHTEYRFGGPGLPAPQALKPVPYAQAELFGPARSLRLGARLRWLALEGTYGADGPGLSAQGSLAMVARLGKSSKGKDDS